MSAWSGKRISVKFSDSRLFASRTDVCSKPRFCVCLYLNHDDVHRLVAVGSCAWFLTQHNFQSHALGLRSLFHEQRQCVCVCVCVCMYSYIYIFAICLYTHVHTSSIVHVPLKNISVPKMSISDAQCGYLTLT